MPQASEELRAIMEQRFGDPIDSAGPIKFLQDAGYTLTRKWFWIPKPGVIDLGQMTRDEFDCLLFLVHEWDFGGLTEGKTA
jgi:hypothetical protein